jgi:GntR family transcriptional regulator
VRDDRRHKWETDRARQPLAQRASTGATEHETGLTAQDPPQDLEQDPTRDRLGKALPNQRFLTKDQTQDPLPRTEHDAVTASEELVEAFGVSKGTPLPHRLVTSYPLRDMFAAGSQLPDVSREPCPPAGARTTPERW